MHLPTILPANLTLNKAMLCTRYIFILSVFECLLTLSIYVIFCNKPLYDFQLKTFCMSLEEHLLVRKVCDRLSPLFQLANADFYLIVLIIISFVNKMYVGTRKNFAYLGFRSVKYLLEGTQ